MDSQSTTLASRFFERFRGLDRAHGIYTIKGKRKDGEKHTGGAKTHRSAPTVELWERHLKGELTLGIVPIRDDQTCVFGAIDIDEYDGLDHAAISGKIQKADLPLIVCRSKSGGAHVYLFCREPIPAELVRNKLMEWAVYLGFSGVEVFPKQTRLAGQNDIGNWINMPYFGAAKGSSDRHALRDSTPLTAEEFLVYAADLAQTYDSLREAAPPEDGDAFHDLLHQAPPCLQALAHRGGIGEGGRNNGLFNIGVYLRKRFGDEGWAQHLDEYNNALLNPPLGHREVAQIVKSVNRKAYEYKCGDKPICDVCNKQICLSREFGIGTGPGDPGVVFGQLIKLETDPVMWIWDVNGERIELTTAQLKDQGRFHSRVMEELSIWPQAIKPMEWARLVREHLGMVEVMDVPLDAKPQGQMWFHLEQYCTAQSRARSKDQLLQHKPWTDGGRTYFHGPHFHQYLNRQGLKIQARTLWFWLRDGGAETHFFNLKGRGINVWSVPAFEEQTEGFDLPVIANQEEM